MSKLSNLGFATHSMGGGHDLSMLRRAVVFELDTSLIKSAP